MRGKKWCLTALILFWLCTQSGVTHSAIKPNPVSMGKWISVTSSTSAIFWECYLWKDNPILIDIQGQAQIVLTEPQSVQLQVLDKSTKVKADKDSFFTFQLKSSGLSNFRCRYEFPNVAFVSFASLYKNLAIPWQKRLYHQNRLDFLDLPKINQADLEKPLIGEQKMGAPYGWGGKQSLEEIARKLKQHPPNQSWISIRLQYPGVSAVNLDEGESVWDTPKGVEYPSNWCGLDCSGLVEQCARYAGLQFNWRLSPVIASGTYQGISNYEKLQAGDVIMIIKEGILVHFGILSKKGSSVRTTKMIHTVWFTNYRLHHNSVMKTIETSLAELSNHYEYQFIRLNP